MNKLLNAVQLNREFIKLINQCDEYYMMVAWATDECPAFKALMKNAVKIKRAIVGLDFNHTSPKFIRNAMKKNTHIRFICESKCVFHPKLYILINNRDRKSAVIIGSSNFTKGGLGKNYEISLLIPWKYKDALLMKLIQMVNEKYKEAHRMSEAKIMKYEEQYKEHRNFVKKTEYKEDLNGFDMGWNDMKRMIERNDVHPLEDCITILDKATKMLRKGFNNLDENEKGFFVGKNRWDEKTDWYCFGDMRRVLPKSFCKWDYIGKALDCIPSFGKVVEREHFEKFFIFLDRGVKIEKGISFASRLLCFKRPDFFVSVTSTNIKRLRELFGMKIGTREEYWQFVQELQTSKWYSDAPRNYKWYRYRMALLDVVAYNP